MSKHLHVDDLIARIDRKRLAALNAMEAAGIGYWSWDLHDRFEWSPLTCELFGIDEERAPQSLVDFLSLLDEESQKRFLDATESAHKEAGQLCVTLRTDKIPSKAKRVKLVGRALLPEGSMNQELTGVCLPADPEEDQSPERRPGNLTDSWRELIEVSSDICVEVDFEGRILAVNPAMERSLGYARDELVGRFLYDFIHASDIARTQAVYRTILGDLRDKPATNVDANFENRYRRRDGQYRCFSWSWMADPDKRRIYGIARDVTENKRLQESQKAILEQLTRSNRDLQNFASVASHDLREPLRMITGYLRLLQERSPDALDEKGRKFVRYACEGADRMRQLIEDLLAYSKLEHTALETRSVDLVAILKEARDQLMPTIQARQASVDFCLQPQMPVAGDSIQLTRLFQNLLSNAMKFQKEDRLPHIRVRATSEADPMGLEGWRVSVEDNGIGIDPEQGRLLFQLFQRLNTRDEFDGSGIGLAVCKRVVDMHHGRIWFDSSPGNGSTFHVWLKKEPSPG
ncbi:MAG: sensor histidine kinase [Verrucomicrobiota bacterium]